ncbi:hypothetical protein MSG28_010322 [Choristoneura fumiferana]|uniref:Uncharacterized protein n=1 Tax=Choristoneura fumiferana TaxID=7141 RepID=A0ACC0KKR4_CHOFU|nr:hypothetical protein MSG28_010322 [Choristoneura fumiferana]
MCGTAATQSTDELQIPVENDNQFPPENHAESDVIDGSGEGIVDTTTDISPPPELEAMEAIKHLTAEVNITPEEEIPCPKTCVCNVQGESNLFTVDCSGYGLTEFPYPIDEKTSTLNLKDNKLTEIPKSISTLKNLKVLNAENNLIMELSPGSVSELPELNVLKLANNRLIEYPNDLKNSLVLTKLEELDLGGNDMRTTLNPETFLNFKSLRKLTLPTTTKELNEDICNNLKGTLEMICTGTCGNELHDCEDTQKPIDIEDEMFVEAKLPAVLTAPDSDDNMEMEPQINSTRDNGVTNVDSGTEETPSETQTPSTAIKANSEIVSPVNNFSLRTAVYKASSEGESLQTGKPIENANQEAAPSNEENIKIGATTSDTKTGGVDKSVIGIIVAAMVVVVAGVTIKKNWSSIKKRFSSTPRPANERVANGNGSTPEEVPLQDKSPV